MTKPYRLTPEQWESIERYAEDNVYDACFLELRARIEALEAAQHAPMVVEGTFKHVGETYRFKAKPERATPMDEAQPAGSLVERVADAIAAQATSAGIVNDRPARAAILEVAAWLRSQDDGLLAYGLDWATRLQREANR
jgi:hypothetical protein